MADDSTSYTYIGEASWWKLREQFKRRVPTTVNLSYVTSLLGIKEGSARSNIINPLKKIGIIDENGNPTDRANDWRDDAKYPAVCQSIIEECYPEALRDVYHDASQGITPLVSWFMNSNRLGESAAYKYANFYYLLLRADPTDLNSKPKTSSSQAVNKPKAPSKKRESKAANSNAAGIASESSASIVLQEEQPTKDQQVKLSTIPQLHINIQLHISPETNAEQIDKIFESMAKHLKSFAEKGN